MTWLIRRFRWLILGWIARFLARTSLKRSVDRKVDEAVATIEQKLPTSVVKAAERLPGDIVRAGGAAMVAGQTTRSASGKAVEVGAKAKRIWSKGGSVSHRAKNIRTGVSSEIRYEADQARRRMKSDVARQTEGEAAALEALLDLRDLEAEPIPPVPDPIVQGRRRFRPELPSSPVNRVQRTYRPAVKPWDRISRRKIDSESSDDDR